MCHIWIYLMHHKFLRLMVFKIVTKYIAMNFLSSLLVIVNAKEKLDNLLTKWENWWIFNAFSSDPIYCSDLQFQTRFNKCHNIFFVCLIIGSCSTKSCSSRTQRRNDFYVFINFMAFWMNSHYHDTPHLTSTIKCCWKKRHESFLCC